MEYTLEKVDIKEKMSGEKNGRKWSFTPVGLRINGKWYSGAINDDRILETLKDGVSIDLILFEDKGYSKFKIPKESDKQNDRLDKAAKLLKDLSDKFNDLDKRMDVIKTNYDDMNKRLDIIYNNPEIKKLITNLT